MSRYTASVVGGGGGGRLSMTGLAASERFQLAAAADIRPEICEELKRLYPGIKTFPSHERMFAECPTDVVCVSTWAPSHRPIAQEALKLPLKGILVEKPLGDTAEAGREILRAIQAKRLPVAVPHGLLVMDHSIEILKRVHAGEIGDLKLVEIQCRRWDIINAGIHWMDFFVTLVRDDPIDHVMSLCESSTRTYRDGMQVETTAVTLTQTKDGVRCVMVTGDDVQVGRDGKGCLFRLVGSKGTIEFWGWESAYILLNAQHPEGKLIEVPKGTRTNHQRHLERLAEHMDAGTADYSIPLGSLRALEICEAAYLSSRRQCKVVFPFEGFTPPPRSDWDPGMPYSGSGGGRDGRKL